MGRGEENPRPIPEWAGGRGEGGGGPTKQDRAVSGDAGKVQGDDAKHISEIAKGVAEIVLTQFKGKSPLNQLVGISLRDNVWFASEGENIPLNDDELAYFIDALGKNGIRVVWNGHDYIAYRANAEDDD